MTLFSSDDYGAMGDDDHRGEPYAEFDDRPDAPPAGPTVADLAADDPVVDDLAVEDLAVDDLDVEDLAVEDLAVDELIADDLSADDRTVAAAAEPTAVLTPTAEPTPAAEAPSADAVAAAVAAAGIGRPTSTPAATSTPATPARRPVPAPAPTPTVEAAPRASGRQCSRPDCSRLAEVTLTYEYRKSHVWLDALTGEREPHAYDLCGHHAAELTVPIGWTLSDRRQTLGITARLAG